MCGGRTEPQRTVEQRSYSSDAPGRPASVARPTTRLCGGDVNVDKEARGAERTNVLATRHGTVHVVPMPKRMTITLDEAVYDGLFQTVKRGRVSRFIRDLLRPLVSADALENGYRLMAARCGARE